MRAKIHCPKCDRILGDTDHQIDGMRINCRVCKNTVDINLKLTYNDGFYSKITRKEENHDKSR